MFLLTLKIERAGSGEPHLQSQHVRGRARRISEFKASLISIASSRPVRDTLKMSQKGGDWRGDPWVRPLASEHEGWRSNSQSLHKFQVGVMAHL